MVRAGGVYKHVLGDSITLTHVADASTETVTMGFEEYLGAIDDKRRGMAYGLTDDFTTAPVRGDTFVYDSRTWICTNIVIAEDGYTTLIVQAATEVA